MMIYDDVLRYIFADVFIGGDLHAERRSRVQQVCQEQSVSTSNQHFLKYLIVNDRLKTLYCYVPKAGSSSWKALFVKLSGIHPPTSKNGEAFRVYHLRDTLFRANITQLVKFSPEERQHKLDTYFKFLIVRHPLDRLASAFYDKFRYDYSYTVQLRKKLAPFIIEHFRNRHGVTVQQSKVNFDEFIDFILSGLKQATNEHWATYQRLCQPCMVNYDYIGTAETIEEDVPRILKRMDAEEHIADFENIHKTKPSDSFYRSFYDNVTVGMLEKLVSLYGTDMNMFGYSWKHYMFGSWTSSE